MAREAARNPTPHKTALDNLDVYNRERDVCNEREEEEGERLRRKEGGRGLDYTYENKGFIGCLAGGISRW